MPQCSDVNVTSLVTKVTCNVTANASNIHKSLESLEVRPVVVPADSPCISGLSVIDTAAGTTPRQFVVVVNVSTSPERSCSALNLTLNSTVLAGKLETTIDRQEPDFKHNIFTLQPAGQGMHACTRNVCRGRVGFSRHAFHNIRGLAVVGPGGYPLVSCTWVSHPEFFLKLKRPCRRILRHTK